MKNRPGSHKIAGRYNKKAWYPHDEFQVEGSFETRPPSRSYPFNYTNHFYTLKYSLLLYEQNYDLWKQVVDWNTLKRTEAERLVREHSEDKETVAKIVACFMRGELK